MLINNLSTHIAQHRQLIDAAINRVLDRSWLILGPEVDSFEKTFAVYLGAAHCVSVANGTDAIELALKAIGVCSGDRVATVANAGMYTATALLSIGAEPLFMDVDLDSRSVTLSEVQRALDAGVKAVAVTHLYGLAVPEIEAIANLCKKQSVPLLEDCAQAHGALINGRCTGTFGDAASFSFYPTKNLGALGDGGAVVTNNVDIAEKVSRLRQYGWTAKYQVELAGARNSRLDELQAAVLSEFLPHLGGWNGRRREIASQYSMRITHPAVILPLGCGDDYVAHLYVVRCVERYSLRQHLRRLDIATDVHYPIPDHRQPVFGNRYADVCLSNTEQLAQEVLTLPCYPEMSDKQVDEVISGCNSWRT